jgi:hypothetical protein
LVLQLVKGRLSLQGHTRSAKEKKSNCNEHLLFSIETKQYLEEILKGIKKRELTVSLIKSLPIVANQCKILSENHSNDQAERYQSAREVLAWLEAVHRYARKTARREKETRRKELASIETSMLDCT